MKFANIPGKSGQISAIKGEDECFIPTLFNPHTHTACTSMMCANAAHLFLFDKTCLRCMESVLEKESFPSTKLLNIKLRCFNQVYSSCQPWHAVSLLQDARGIYTDMLLFRAAEQGR